jgi:A/G-specific adenine glycosylase
MAVGQDVCLPNGRPNCAECPLCHICRAHGAGEETRYPNKPPKKARRKEKLTVLLLRHGERFALELRPDEGLLAGLWQFPNLGGHLSPEDTLEVAEGFALSPIGVTKLPPAAHIFTHVEWDMVGYLVECGTESDRFTFASPAEIRQTYPIASAFRLYRQIAAPEE